MRHSIFTQLLLRRAAITAAAASTQILLTQRQHLTHQLLHLNLVMRCYLAHLCGGCAQQEQARAPTWQTYGHLLWAHRQRCGMPFPYVSTLRPPTGTTYRLPAQPR